MKMTDYSYYQDKTFCRLDLHLLHFSYDKRQIPSSHPYIKFLIFLEDLKDRNRLQNTLKLVYKTTTYKEARSLHSSQFSFNRECVISDLKWRIKEKEDKIEAFHKTYTI